MILYSKLKVKQEVKRICTRQCNFHEYVSMDKEVNKLSKSSNKLCTCILINYQ